jgi:Rieske Fe-S protein
METSRRDVLAIAAATITLPMLQSALGNLQTAHAQAGGNGGAAPIEPGWFTTTLKPAALKDNEFAAIPNRPAVILSRAGKEVAALSSKCTHKGCTIRPRAAAKVLTCACHNSQFNLDGTVAKGDAAGPLPRYAIRTNAAGFIEIDPGQTPAAEAAEYKLTLP